MDLERERKTRVEDKPFARYSELYCGICRCHVLLRAVCVDRFCPNRVRGDYHFQHHWRGDRRNVNQNTRRFQNSVRFPQGLDHALLSYPHKEDASNTILNSPKENGRAVALAHKTSTSPRSSTPRRCEAARMSGSFMSIATTDRGSAAY